MPKKRAIAFNANLSKPSYGGVRGRVQAGLHTKGGRTFTGDLKRDGVGTSLQLSHRGKRGRVSTIALGRTSDKAAAMNRKTVALPATGGRDPAPISQRSLEKMPRVHVEAGAPPRRRRHTRNRDPNTARSIRT
jgi:hypothetical protein